MPWTHEPLVAGERAARTDLGGMAAEVKGQHILRCFEQSNAVALFARIIEFVLGKARVAELCPARREITCLPLMNDVNRSSRSGVPVEFVCGGSDVPRV